ncbi:hypothetical protein TRICI_002029 [Trichomonascus ciferrii]|uniref:Uncharacterized protein n=1 Tax=Trichomonascus ciferrii TaxID=44093 RepID=A0A642V7Z0_9ASCO|nr:hypothetical protein TRICI_002029 [Trichomonascus ciferrii]
MQSKSISSSSLYMFDEPFVGGEEHHAHDASAEEGHGEASVHASRVHSEDASGPDLIHGAALELGDVQTHGPGVHIALDHAFVRVDWIDHQP